MPDCNRRLSAEELLTRATSLLDLGDALTDAIERNYTESARLRDALGVDEPRVDPRPALSAHSRLEALVEHAQHLLDAQRRELDLLTVELATAPRSERSAEGEPV